MFAFLKKLFGKPVKAEVKVNTVIARAEASNVMVQSKKTPLAKKSAVKAKTSRKPKTKSAG